MPSSSRSKQNRPWWQRWYVIVALVAVIVLAIALVPRLWGGGAPGGTASSSATGTSFADWNDALTAYEKEHNLDVSSAWGGVVVTRAVENNSELRFYTTLDNNEAANKVGKEICDAYLDFPKTDSRIRLIVVFSQDGVPIATCGPAA